MIFKKNIISIILLITFFSINAQKAVPDFSEEDIYGYRHELYTNYLNKGKFVFIDFFTNGCISCQEVAPKVDTVFRDFGCNYGNIVFLGINANHLNGTGTDSLVFDFAQRFGMSFPAISGLDGNGISIFNDYNIPYTPYHILISPEKLIVMDTWGFNTATTLKDSLINFGLTLQDCQGKDFIFYSLVSETDSVVGEIDLDQQNVSVSMPFGTDLTQLTANFINAINSDIEISGIPQISGETINDFSSLVTYKITSETGEFQDWTVSVNLISSIKFLEKKFSVYPNPSNGNIIIENNFFKKNESKDNKATIIDISGKILKTFNISEQYLNIDLTSFPKGIYFVNITSGNSAVVKKIMLF